MSHHVRSAHVPASIPRLLVLLWVATLGLALLPTTVEAQSGEGGVTPARVAGTDRFETAARIANLTYDQADVAVVVTGRKFPDALAASYIARLLAGPILLVEPDGVPPSTLATLEDLGVQTVMILGGTGAVGDEVEQQLQAEGYALERVAGENRYETAAAVATRYGAQHVGTLDGDRTAILATGWNFPDALSGGPLAARANLPLLLTPQSGTLPVVDKALADLGIERVVILGGPNAVSHAVAQSYQNKGYTVERLAGDDRLETAAVVADNAISRFGFSEENVLLARGDEFPDALTASVHGAAVAAPIVLTRTPDVLGGPSEAWLGAHCPNIGVIRALGGPGAVAESTLGAAIHAAEQCLGAPQEVGRFTTPLPQPNPDRTHNIHLAADYIDGDVIASGASYSLNQGIGRRTTARGFREVQNGCIGAGGEAVDCVGGGVSQMGTTFMNAAWFTGIELVEFRQHTIYFPRYPVCHEATLSYGTLDVVVHNNSPYDIVIDTFYNNEHVGVRYLSQPWAEVESWAEPQPPPSSGGFTSSCGRTITYPDGTSTTESYSWTYDDTGF